MSWQTDPTRWMTKDGEHYYLVPVSKLGHRTVEQIHGILRREERKAYMRKYNKQRGGR